MVRQAARPGKPARANPLSCGMRGASEDGARPALRRERPGDEPAIARVVAAAFAGIPHSDGSEPAIVAELRRAGALTLSLVAELEGELAGHAAFSPVEIGDGAAGWYGLGPVAVRPDVQRRGVGGALVRWGLELLRERGASGCVVFGWPDYYARFGFRREPRLVLPGLPQEHFQALAFRGEVPRGEVRYAAAFGSA